jgi:K+-transporting ATPase A subunit
MPDFLVVVGIVLTFFPAVAHGPIAEQLSHGKFF